MHARDYTSRSNRPQATYSEKEWCTAKAPRQLISLKFEHDLRNFLCSRGVLADPAPVRYLRLCVSAPVRYLRLCRAVC